VLAALGFCCIVVGGLGRRESLDSSVGGWTRDTATPEIGSTRITSWVRGSSAVACSRARSSRSPRRRALGRIVAATSVALLVSVVVGVVSGTNRLVAQ
jgi:hypothetical protein